MFNKYINILILTSLALSVLNSCVDLVEGQDEGMGYLSLSELSAEVEVYELVPTRSGKSSLSALVGEYNQPDISKVSFTLKGTDYSKTWEGALTEEIALSAGIYTLSAVYNNGDYDGFEEALYGQSSQEISISSFNTTIPTVKLPLANSLVAVTMADGFDNHFTPDEGTPVEISYETAETNAAIGEYVFVPASQAINVKVVGTNSAGVEKTTLTYSGLTSPVANTAYNVVCGLTTSNVPSVTLTENLSAGAFEDALYFSAATLNNITGGSVNSLVYELRTGSGDWNKVTTTEVTGSDSQKYRCISGLVAGGSYSLRARVGNIVSNEVSFSPVTFASCLTEVNASANHTYSSSELTGTAVTASAKVTLPSIIQKLATVTATGIFSNSSGETRSSLGETSLKVDGTVTSLTMTNPSDWPYIPKGEGHKLALNATCTIGNKSYSTSSSKESIEVGAPDFSVTVSGYTTYDKYLEYTNTGKSDALSSANAEGKAEYIFQISTSVGISEALLKNSNYTTKVYYTCGPYTNVEYSFVNGEGDINTSVKVHNIGDVGGFSWGENTLTSKVSFAGTEISNSRTCYITGLPYTPEAMIEGHWGLSSWNCEYNNGTIQLGAVSGSGSCIATSKMAFHIPSEIAIKLNTNVTIRAFKFGLWYDTDFTVKVNGSQIIKQNSNKQDNDNTGKNYNLSGTSKFTSSHSSVEMESSYTAAGPWSKVHSLKIYYNNTN